MKAKPRIRRILLALLFILIASLVYWIWLKRPPKPTLEFVSIQPSGLYEESGTPLDLVQFKVKSEWSVLYQNMGETVEACGRDSQIRQRAISAGYDICLVPAGTKKCYISVEYARQSPTLYNYIPLWIRSRLPARARQWIEARALNRYRQPNYVTRRWFKTVLELHIPDEPKRP